MDKEILRVLNEMNKANGEWYEADKARTAASKKHAKLQLEFEALRLEYRRAKANKT